MDQSENFDTFFGQSEKFGLIVAHAHWRSVQQLVDNVNIEKVCRYFSWINENVGGFKSILTLNNILKYIGCLLYFYKGNDR